MKSEERFDLIVRFTFNTSEERQAFTNSLIAMSPPPRSTEYKSHFTACKLCGISSTYQTLGSGIPGSGTYKDECHPAYARSCQARQERNQELLDGLTQ